MEQKNSVSTSAKTTNNKNKPQINFNEKKSAKVAMKKNSIKLDSYAEFDFHACKNTKNNLEKSSSEIVEDSKSFIVENEVINSLSSYAETTEISNVLLPETSNICFSEDVEKIINIARVGALFDW